MSKKHVSRKLKSAWRKHIDISDVDRFLEEQRQDERAGGGKIGEKPDVELFTEDRKTSASKPTLREIRKKKFDELPRSLLPLVNTSNVSDPIVKRNIKKNRNPIAPVAPTPVRIKKRGRPSGIAPATAEDIWAKDPVPAELKNEWIGKELLHHTLRNVGKPLVTNLPARMDKAQRVLPLRKKLPDEGLSYNPAIDDYLKLKQRVIKQEQAVIKKEQHYDRVVTQMFVKVTPEERHITELKEMSEGLVTAVKPEPENKAPASKAKEAPAEEAAAEDAAADTPPAVVVAKRKKPISRAKKRAREVQEQEEKLIQREISKLIAIDNLDEISKEIEKNERKAKLIAKKRAIKKKVLRSRIKMPLEFVEPQQLSGSLRTIQPLTNLLATGLPKARKVAILQRSRGEVERKKHRVKKVRYTRSSHKELVPESKA
ncbi:ribosome biogenesis protein NOP53 [Anopheles stephensi]|uniref:ribosome biogenesis protein NOP53 n=1 Tax=Anopheles stephensi TaxID=30069 RepID=UPI00165871FC|nr:ribosome biogenesis protein NOP53 [Anopheles stephensi]